MTIRTLSNFIISLEDISTLYAYPKPELKQISTHLLTLLAASASSALREAYIKVMQNNCFFFLTLPKSSHTTLPRASANPLEHCASSCTALYCPEKRTTNSVPGAGLEQR